MDFLHFDIPVVDTHMAQNTQEVGQAGPVRLSLGYKVIWGIASLGTSLISGIYAAL